MKKSATMLLGVLIGAAVVAVVSTAGATARYTKARAIKIGDTKAHVQQELGRATMVTSFSPMWRTNAMAALLGETAETWAYGSRFDFSSEFPWLRFRWLLPDPDDITVEFSTSGRVVRVTIP